MNPRTTRHSGGASEERKCMKTFNLNLHPAISRGIQDMGFTEPTPIQRDAIPPALAGRAIAARGARRLRHS